MTAMTGSTDCLPHRLAATRDGPHRAAEHVLAAARYAAAAFFRDARTHVTTPARRTS